MSKKRVIYYQREVLAPDTHVLTFEAKRGKAISEPKSHVCDDFCRSCGCKQAETWRNV